MVSHLNSIIYHFSMSSHILFICHLFLNPPPPLDWILGIVAGLEYIFFHFPVSSVLHRERNAVIQWVIAIAIVCVCVCEWQIAYKWLNDKALG